MTEQRRDTREPRHETEEEPAPPPSEADRSAKEVSASTDDVLDDIDRALKAALGFEEDEIVDDQELEARAKDMVDKYRQKGGE